MPFEYKFNKLEIKEMGGYSTSGPKYRYVIAGLNLIGTCTTVGCVA